MTDALTTHQLFLQAIALLGGQRPACQRTGISERHMRGLCSGARKLHEGHLRDLARALLEHGDDCRALERRLNPLFTSNRPPDLPRETGNRTGARHNRKPLALSSRHDAETAYARYLAAKLEPPSNG